MRTLRYCLVVAAFLVGIVGQAEATSILDFEGLGLGTNAYIPATYGDNLPGTPNITVEYRTFNPAAGILNDYTLYDGFYKGRFRFYASGYGALLNAATPGLGGDGFQAWLGEISLVAASGFLVHLNSFQLAGWGTVSGQPLRILDGNGNVLLDYGLLTLGSLSNFTPNFTADTLRIQFANTDYVGIDNISFDQVAAAVPEPSMLLLLGFGLVGVVAVARTWRRQR